MSASDAPPRLSGAGARPVAPQRELPLRWTGELADPVAEGRFHEFRVARSAGTLSTLAAMFAVAYLAFAVPDVAVLGFTARWAVVVAVRVAGAVLMGGLAVAVRRRPSWVATSRGTWLVSAVAAATLAGVLAVTALKPVGTTNLNLSAVLAGVGVLTVVPIPFLHRATLVGAFYGAHVALANAVFDPAQLRIGPFVGMFTIAYLGGAALAVHTNRIERLAVAALQRAEVANEELVRRVHEADVLRRELIRVAAEDELTGLPTRRAFLEQATAAVAAADRTGGPVSAIAIDADGFKAINDRFGHAAGDEALRLLAAALQGAIRVDDVVGRLGGEEFAVVVPGADPTAAREVAERIRAGVAATPVRLTCGPLPLTVSVGLAERQRDEALDALLGRADAAMYAAKRAGGNRVAEHPAEVDAARRSA